VAEIWVNLKLLGKARETIRVHFQKGQEGTKKQEDEEKGRSKEGKEDGIGDIWDA